MKTVHSPYIKLAGYLRGMDVTYAIAAKVLGITETTFCRKINGRSDFSLAEIEKLAEAYGEDLKKIFYK